MSIRRAGLGFSGLIAGAVLLGASSSVIGEINRLNASNRTSDSVTATALLFQATINLSLERSLTQVGLALPDSFPSRFQEMLDQQRALSEARFADLETLLAKAELPNEDRFTEEVRKLRSAMAEIRALADPDLAVPLGERRSAQPDTIPRLKQTIAALQQAANWVRPSPEQVSIEVTAHDLLMQRAWVIREYGGRERTYFAIATALRAPLSDPALAEMHEAHGRVMQAWELADPLARSADIDPAVQRAVETMREAYFGPYIQLRERLYEQADTGTYPIDFDRYFEVSSRALDAAVAVVVAAGEANKAAADRQRDQSALKLALILCVAAGGLALAWFLVRYLLVNVAGRVNTLTDAMRRTAAGDLTADIERLRGEDEVGQMARALETFQANARARSALEQRSGEDRQKELSRQDRIEKLVQSFRDSAEDVQGRLSRETSAMAESAERLAQVSARSTSKAAQSR